MQFLVKLYDIKKFCKKTNLCINVYGINKNEDLIPLRTTKKPEKPEKIHIDLLFITSSKKSHYILIKNWTRAVSSQY